jgi:hypothetical protein
MSTAQGNVASSSANRITATFVVDGIQFTFAAQVKQSVTPFTSKTATLNYSERDALTGVRTLNGFFTADTFELTLGNGPSIKGDLNSPGVDPRVDVDGSGLWESDICKRFRLKMAYLMPNLTIIRIDDVGSTTPIRNLEIGRLNAEAEAWSPCLVVERQKPIQLVPSYDNLSVTSLSGRALARVQSLRMSQAL